MLAIARRLIGTLTVAFMLMSNSAIADSTWTVYNAMNSPLPTDYVSSIYFDHEDNQYIGTSGGGLVLKRGSSWTIWDQSNTEVPIDAVRLTTRDATGDLWLAAASGDLDSSPYGLGVAHLNAGDSSWTMRNGGLEINQIATGIFVLDESRYVSTYGGGITIYSDFGWVRYRYSSRTEFSYADSQQQVFDVPPGTYIPSDYVRAIDIDNVGGTLWIITADAGVVRKTDDEWTTFNSSNSGLPSNQLLSVRIDPYNGNVYFGTAGFGFAVLDDTFWSVYDPSNSPMTNGFISTIEVRPGDGELWVGTGQGVWVLQTDSLWRSYMPPDDNFIWGEFYSDISFDSTGLAWVSAYGGGMASLNFDSLPPPDTLDIDVDRMFIFFFNNRPVERIFSKINVGNAPELSEDDSISFRLDSDLGELYGFEVSLNDFRRGFFHHGGRTTYRYFHDRLLIFLRIKDDDPSDIRMTILDFDAEMNRDHYQNILTVTMGIAGVFGSQVISLSGGNQWDVPELNVEGETGTAQTFGFFDTPTDIYDEVETPIAADLELINYPNPFNGQTKISFNLPLGAYVDLKVFDVLGRMLDNPHSGYLSAGRHQFFWPQAGSSAMQKSGIYFYRVTIDSVSISGKMLYLK